MNPMVLMMGLPLLMIFLMPKMMASIDPETMKEFRQTQAETQRLQQSASGEELTSRLASMLSGSSSNK